MASGLAAARTQGFASVRPATLASIAVVLAWGGVAFLWRDQYYDELSIVASAAVLAGAIGFYRWQAPDHLEGYRMLGFYALGNTFMTSGLGMLVEVEGGRVRPTVEAFSAAVQGTMVFAAVFVAAARITAPRTSTARATVPIANEATGPAPAIGWVLAAGCALMTLQGALALNQVNPLGTLPLVLLNPALLVPLFTAQWLLGGKFGRGPLMLIVLAHALTTFLTSSIGAVALVLRDVLLAYVAMRKPLPRAPIAVLMALVFVFNPAKHTFRNAYWAEGGTGTQVTLEKAAGWWVEGLTHAWGSEVDAEKASGAVETTARRVAFNDVAAHVHTVVPGLVPHAGGETYEDIPFVMIPRVLYPDKPTTNYIRVRRNSELGIQSEESAERTSVSVTAPAEAYWNFGWGGIPLVALLLGGVVGLLLRLRPLDPAATIGLSMLIATSLGQCFFDLMVWTPSQMIAAVIAYFLVELYCRLGKKVADPRLLHRRPLRADPRAH